MNAQERFAAVLQKLFPEGSIQLAALMESLHQWQEPERELPYSPALITNWLEGKRSMPPEALSGVLFYLNAEGVQESALERISTLHAQALDEAGINSSHPHAFNTLNQTLDGYLKSIDLMQKEVAEGIGVSTVMLSQYRKGKNPIAESFCIKLDTEFEKSKYKNAPHFTQLFWQEKRQNIQQAQEGEMSIGDMLRTIRSSLGMTEKELADGIGVGPSTMNQWESNDARRRPKLPPVAAVEDMITVFKQRDSELAERLEHYEPMLTDMLIEQLLDKAKTVNEGRNPAYSKYTPNPQNRVNSTHAQHSKPERNNLRE